MKKIISVLLVILVLAGCGTPAKDKNTDTSSAKTDFTRGMWLSFSEIDTLCANGFKSGFDGVIEDMKELCITDLYFHVRSHCDSVVESEYFPQRASGKNADCDILEYAVQKCHGENIRIHAWINPYRVDAGSSDIEKLLADSIARKWAEKKSTNVIIHNGIYLNPAEAEARQLVLKGVREIIDNYGVDGIHFDDYFYPTTSPDFDKISYENYKKSAENALPLADWRRTNVDVLISDCKTLIKGESEDLIFSISPAASIDKNYSELYADIGGWVEKGYVDEIIPQLYFGFEHKSPEFCFPKLLEAWKKSGQKNPSVKLTVGLAAYKIGTQSATDGTEWQERDDILARQTKICLEDTDIDGVVFFSYSSLFSDNSQNIAERDNLVEF